MIIGVIIEACPFHNGHQYLFNLIKKRYNDCTLVCVVSSSFTMRGEISIINKFDKTNYLLKAGADIVLELPITKTLHSGEYFSANAVKILAMVGVEKIICGSTFSSIDEIKKIDEIISSEPFQIELQQSIKNHLSYKKAYTDAFNKLQINQELIDLFNESNNALAWEYYQSIKKNHYPMELELIKRSYQENLPSGRALTKNVFNHIDINNDLFLPFDEKIINLKDAWDNLVILIKYDLLNNKNLYDQITDPEGIDNYIHHNINYQLNNYDIIENLSNKKYSNSFIRRYLLKRLLKINQNNNPNLTYLRLLGFRKEKEYFINQLSKEVKSLIITKINDKIDNKDIKCELLATLIYGIITNNIDLVNQEEKVVPIIYTNNNK